MVQTNKLAIVAFLLSVFTVVLYWLALKNIVSQDYFIWSVLLFAGVLILSVLALVGIAIHKQKGLLLVLGGLAMPVVFFTFVLFGFSLSG